MTNRLSCRVMVAVDTLRYVTDPTRDRKIRSAYAGWKRAVRKRAMELSSLRGEGRVPTQLLRNCAAPPLSHSVPSQPLICPLSPQNGQVQRIAAEAGSNQA